MKATNGRRFLSMLIITLLAGFWLSVIPVKASETSSTGGKTVTKKNENFTVSVEYGIDGWAVCDVPVVANVTISCKENFVGSLRMVPELDYGAQTLAYGKDISLSAGEEKTYTIVLSAVPSYGNTRLEVLDEKEKIVYSETSQVVLDNMGNKIAVGVLSDDYSALSYFDGMVFDVNGEQKMTSILELTKEIIPEESSALAPFQYIIIDNYDTAQLSEEQYYALKDWTRQGGILILALGSNYQNVLHCFQDDFVTGTIGNFTKKDLEWKVMETPAVTPMTAVSDSSTDGNAENATEQLNDTMESGTEDITESDVDDMLKISGVDCVEFELQDGIAMPGFADENAVYQKQVEKGKVVVLSYALGMEPVTSYEGKTDMAYALLQGAWVDATTKSINGGNIYSNPDSSGYSLAASSDTSAKPSTLLYAILLIGYAIFVGPILYVVLKAMKKREKIWVAVPVVAVAFTGVIYLTGMLYRVNKPLVNTFSLVTLDGDVATEKVYTNILCPKAEKYNFHINDDYYGFKTSGNDYIYSMFPTTNKAEGFDYLIKENGAGMDITIYNNESFEETKFSLNHTGENNIGSIDYDLHCMTTGFEGRVTNNTCYDLIEVVVVFETKAYKVGDLKKGEQVTIDSSKVFGISQYDGLRSSYYNNATGMFSDTKQQMTEQIAGMMETNIIDKNAVKQGYVWGRIDSYEPDILADADVKQAGIGLIMHTFTAEYEDIKGVYCANIDAARVSVQGNYDDYDRMMYETDVYATYSFDNYPGITTLTNVSKSEKSTGSITGCPYSDVYAFNQETGQYEQVFVDSDTLSGKELEKYMNDGIILLRYAMPSGAYNAYMPVISAKGDE